MWSSTVATLLIGLVHALPTSAAIEQVFLSAGPEPGQMTVTWQCPVASDNWKVTYAYTIVGSGPATPDQFEGSFTAPPSPGAGSTTLALIG
eukprot:gene5164-22785_t